MHDCEEGGDDGLGGMMGMILIGAEHPRRGGGAKRGAPPLVFGGCRICTCTQSVCMATQCLVRFMPALPAGSSIEFIEGE